VSIISLNKAVLVAFSLVATQDLIENTRRASYTDKVPYAESLRPVNGNESGPRWHCALMFTLLTWLTRMSISSEILVESLPNTEAC